DRPAIPPDGAHVRHDLPPDDARPRWRSLWRAHPAETGPRSCRAHRLFASLRRQVPRTRPADDLPPRALATPRAPSRAPSKRLHRVRQGWLASRRAPGRAAAIASFHLARRHLPADKVRRRPGVLPWSNGAPADLARLAGPEYPKRAADIRAVLRPTE